MHVCLLFVLLKVFVSCVCGLTQALGRDPAAVLRVGHPVVVLEGVHHLQYRAHPADGVVDGHGADELC